MGRLTFRQCLYACARDPQYLRQWARLRGVPLDQLTQLPPYILRKIAIRFIRDVRECVWNTLPPNEKAGGPEDPPAGMRE